MIRAEICTEDSRPDALSYRARNHASFFPPLFVAAANLIMGGVVSSVSIVALNARHDRDTANFSSQGP